MHLQMKDPATPESVKAVCYARRPGNEPGSATDDSEGEHQAAGGRNGGAKSEPGTVASWGDQRVRAMATFASARKAGAAITLPQADAQLQLWPEQQPVCVAQCDASDLACAEE